jgi:hypothetical protein
MDTTHTDIAQILASLAGHVDLRNSNVLQMQQSKDENETEIDWHYAQLLLAGMTPAEIKARVPGLEVQ